MDVLKYFNSNKKTVERKIGRFLVGETLGTGGYSKVKLGIDTKTGQRVALKIMLKKDEGKMTESQKKQLMRELAVMRSVKHPNVIQLIEFDAEGEYPNIDGSTSPCVLTVLELAPNGELFDFLMFTGKFGDVTSRTYFHQLIDGIEACHKLGIAHRDIKPENLLLDENYSLKIADFGFAKFYRDESGHEQKMETTCGTRGYLAPELLRGEKYTHLCDVFACGIILFIMYAGFPPFQYATGSDYWWDKIHTKKYHLFWAAHERTCRFDDNFKEVIQKLLSSNPKTRSDIVEIKKDSWYNGTVRNAKNLKKHVQKRKKTVSKNRVKKLKKVQSEISVNTMNPDINRSDSARVSLQEALKVKHEKEASKLGSYEEFESNLDDYSARDYTFIQSYNEFKTSTRPRDVAERIKHIAVEMHSECQIIKETNLIFIRVGVSDNHGSENIDIGIKQYKTDDDKFMVVFKRFQGDPLKYSNVVNTLFNHDALVKIMDLDENDENIDDDSADDILV